MKRIVDLITQLARDMQSTPHVLIVEDDEHDRFLMGRTLRKMGCEVFETGSATEAESLIRSRLETCPDYPFDVCFVDLKLIDGEGADVIRSIHSAAPKVPVIIVTGFPRGDMIERATAAGYFGLVSKPLEEVTIGQIFQQHRIECTPPMKSQTQ
jgi:DNA-binding NtrC family response regulator